MVVANITRMAEFSPGCSWSTKSERTGSRVVSSWKTDLQRRVKNLNLAIIAWDILWLFQIHIACLYRSMHVNRGTQPIQFQSLHMEKIGSVTPRQSTELWLQYGAIHCNNIAILFENDIGTGTCYCNIVKILNYCPTLLQCNLRYSHSKRNYASSSLVFTIQLVADIIQRRPSCAPPLSTCGHLLTGCACFLTVWR